MADTPHRIERAEEHLVVRRVPELTGHVRVAKRVTEEPVTVDVDVSRHEVTVERRAADRPLQPDEPTVSRGDGEAVLLVTEERLEVRKVPWVVEEIHVGRREVTDQQRVTETVRREAIEVTTEPEARSDRQQPEPQP